jgi:hypothetical protein
MAIYIILSSEINYYRQILDAETLALLNYLVETYPQTVYYIDSEMVESFHAQK